MVLCRPHGGGGLEEPAVADGIFTLLFAFSFVFDVIIPTSTILLEEDSDRSWEGMDEVRVSARYFLSSFRAAELSGSGFLLEEPVVVGVSTFDERREGENLTRCPPLFLLLLARIGLLLLLASPLLVPMLHVDRFLVLRIGKVSSVTRGFGGGGCAGDLIAAMHASRKE